MSERTERIAQTIEGTLVTRRAFYDVKEGVLPNLEDA